MKKSYSGYLYIILCTLIFSLVEVVLKKVSSVFHPLQITALRFFIGGFTLLPFAISSIKKRCAVLHRKDFCFFALIGFLFVCVAMVLYQMAVTYTKASVVAVLFSCNPVFVAVLAHFFLGEPIRRNHIAALGMEIVAVLIIVDPLHTNLNPIGCLLAVLSAILFSLYSVIGKKQASVVGGITVTCLCSLIGSVELILLLLFGNMEAGAACFELMNLALFVNAPLLRGIPLSAIPWLFFIGAINTGIGFVCHMLAMEKNSAQEASLIFLLKPMVAPLFALLFLHEEITKNIWLGIACFLIGSSFGVIPGIIEQREKNQSYRS